MVIVWALDVKIMTNPQANPGWRERQQVELRTLIFETSLELFRTHGNDNTTVQQIASTVGIGKGTFLNHFPSKNHVLQEWYRLLTHTALREVSEQAFVSGRDAVLALAVRLATDVSEDPYLWDAKVTAISSPLLRQEESDLDQEVLAFCKNAIEKDMADGRLTSGVTPGFLTDLVLAILTGTAHIWSISGHRQDLAKTIKTRISFVLDAAQPEKGVK